MRTEIEGMYKDMVVT